MKMKLVIFRAWAGSTKMAFFVIEKDSENTTVQL